MIFVSNFHLGIKWSLERIIIDEKKGNKEPFPSTSLDMKKLKCSYGLN